MEAELFQKEPGSNQQELEPVLVLKMEDEYPVVRAGAVEEGVAAIVAVAASVGSWLGLSVY